jgi:hypothetical protein
VIKYVLEKIFTASPSDRQYMVDNSSVACLQSSAKQTRYLTGDKLNKFIFELRLDPKQTLTLAIIESSKCYFPAPFKNARDHITEKGDAETL